ncbi:MAG TPA: hypothetical protein VF297_27445 [Pyrinomonadaceae bacterium]
MKRRKTKTWEQDARRSPLVRAGSRWLSFARGLSRKRRVAAADPLAFIKQLYGEKFNSVEGGAFPLDKVYRTNGGGLFVSETRVNVSVHPRFDLRFVNVAAERAGSQVFRETTTTVLGHPLHTPLTERERPNAARRTTRAGDAAPSLTVQTWNVSPAVVERTIPAFGYVSVRGQRGQRARRLEPTPHVERVERPVRDGKWTSPSVETSRPTVAPSLAGLRLTSIDLRQHFTHAPRQEFVSLLLKTYLPAAVSREVESARTTGELLSAPPRRARSQVETERRFARTPSPVVMSLRQIAPWTYAEPAARYTPEGGVVEVRTELRSTETLREHTAPRDTQATLLHLLPPASLLTSLSLTSRTLLAGEGGGTWLNVYGSSERAPALPLQLLRTHAAPPQGTREGSPAVHTTRLVNQSVQHEPTSTRDALSSIQTFVGRAPSTVAAGTQAVNTTVFARHGFETVPRGGFEQASAHQRGASGGAISTNATTHGMRGRSVEFVRHLSVSELLRTVTTGAAHVDGRGIDNAPVAELMRAASKHEAGSQTLSDLARNVAATQGMAGAATFLFTKALLRRTEAATGARSQTPNAATAMRLAAGAETEREVKETRAARPEGMALELIRHRREQVLQLPQPGYVFTQPPPRTRLEERQVITKASREEIVEVVRKEVRSLAASTPAVNAPSRADLAGLADEIYSTLARRLLVEKERLGRF